MVRKLWIGKILLENYGQSGELVESSEYFFFDDLPDAGLCCEENFL